MFDGIDWNEQRAATGKVMRMLTCCEGIRKEKKRAVSVLELTEGLGLAEAGARCLTALIGTSSEQQLEK